MNLCVVFIFCVCVLVEKKGNRERKVSQSMKWKAGGLCCLKTLRSVLINEAKQSNFTLAQADFVSGSTTRLPTRVHASFPPPSPRQRVQLLAIQIILRMASHLKRALTVHRVLAFCQG